MQQGLLPSPGTRGPGTKYDRAMVDRLHLIRMLQRDHWPLAKIRSHVEALDDDGVRRELGQPPELPLAGETVREGVSEPAAKYIRTVLGRGAQRPPADAEQIEGMLFERTPAYGAAPEPPQPTKWQVTQSTWERIRLTRDVELNIRRPLTREQNKRVDRLLEAAREIFSEDE